MSRPPMVPANIVAGLRGPQGLPGVNAVPADTAVAAYFDDESSDTYAAMTAGFAVGQVVTHPRWGADPTGVIDSTAAIRACFDFVVAAGGGRVHFPKGTYKISDTIWIRKGVTVTCDSLGDLTATAAPTAPAARLEWYGAANGTMVEVCAEATGNTVYYLDWRGPALLGRNLAGYGLYCKSMRYGHVDLHAERCTIAGWFNDDSNDALWADNDSSFYFYDSGSNAASENSHGFVMWNTSGHSGYSGDPLNLGCTNFAGGVMVTNTKNGDGIRIGDTDACYIEKTHHVRKSGGTGKGIRFCNDQGVMLVPGGAATGTRADGMKAQPRVARKIVIGYVVGGIVHAEDGTGPNGIRTINSESTSYEGAAAATHFHVFDRNHGDMFRTHEYVMDDELPVPVGLGAGSATRATLATLLIPVIRFAGAATNDWALFYPCPRSWANGRIRGVRILHAAAAGDGTGLVNGIRVTVEVKPIAVGVNLTTGATSKTETLTIATANNTVVQSDVLFATPADYTRGQGIYLRLSRLGGDALDTSASAWDVLSMQFLYTSDGPDSDAIDSFQIPLPYLT